mmetsp:Transcript_1204/g.2682  ORF Transcript_1204/g.2682 Transcript_1204/m.2682 type:complete len:283 (+) Transcript_1204:103-951(+)
MAARRPCRIKSEFVKQCLAGFFGTFIILMFGDGVVAQVKMGTGVGGYININVAWGIGVILAIHSSAGVSGAHLNPAVTSTMALFGRFPVWKMPGYILSQILGAFTAALTVWFLYRPLFNKYDPDGTEKSMGIFCTYPYQFDDGTHVSNIDCFITEIIATAMLVAMVFALGDDQNKPNHHPAATGMLVIGVGMAFGVQSGYALNPARDLGPRIASAFRYGSKVFTAFNHYWWIPVVGPVIGGALGGSVYQLFIGMHHEEKLEFESQNETCELSRVAPPTNEMV